MVSLVPLESTVALVVSLVPLESTVALVVSLVQVESSDSFVTVVETPQESSDFLVVSALSPEPFLTAAFMLESMLFSFAVSVVLLALLFSRT